MNVTPEADLAQRPTVRQPRRKMLRRLGLAGLASLLGPTVLGARQIAGQVPAPGAGAGTPIRLKVLTVAMYQDLARIAEPESGEAHLWVVRDGLSRQLAVAGAYSPLYLDAAGEHGLIVTGEGASNAAATMMAVGLSPHLDLRQTYVMVAGIAGTPPDVGTVGTAAWAEWVINAGSANEIDPRELPSDWLYPYFHLGCTTPWCTTGYSTGNNVFHLNPMLTAAAFRLSADIALADSDAARAERARYSGATATGAPRVIRADSVSSETFFGGRILSDWQAWWTRQWTDGQGTYGMADNEDHGTMTSLQRLATAGRVDWDRVMVLRAASDFDQPHPGQTAMEAFGLPHAHGLALENAYRAGSAVTREIIANWQAWRAGPPAA